MFSNLDSVKDINSWIEERWKAVPFDFNDVGGFGKKDHLRGTHSLSDIAAHLPMLYFLACHCGHVTEFGMRDGHSTSAFILGCGRVVSYDINTYETVKVLSQLEPKGRWDFVRADTSRLDSIEETDLLFIDSLHTYDQVKAELEMAKFVRRWLVFHDTVSQGEKSLDVPGEEGIIRAIDEFLTENKEWVIAYAAPFNHGLMVLEKKSV